MVFKMKTHLIREYLKFRGEKFWSIPCQVIQTFLQKGANVFNWPSKCLNNYIFFSLLSLNFTICPEGECTGIQNSSLKY